MLYRIRPMAEDDIKNVLRIQTAVYPPNILESAAFFENRLSLSADSCWVAANGSEPSGSLLGYLISYPWQRAFPPELDGTLDALPKFADSWFVHDCAIAPNAQRLGVGKALFNAARRSAKRQGLSHTSLVSLAQAKSYWQSQGYQPVAETPRLREKLKAYGEGACYMHREPTSEAC
ncbi:GNAT family N-acetyltransferase [Leminorella grimontii]|uniref:GNAT family N-acetyltransferase n=1 Tax=Leminorella grimontii TaxID=82981 RepID=UPI002083E079|nr:GNAT family N-acetyltransferase [Leminorella grimontii]GKX59592.1 acetyltransferase [Leminorella grimontii]